MLEALDDLPTGVFGFQGVGELHPDDHTDGLPALRAATEQLGWMTAGDLEHLPRPERAAAVARAAGD